MGTGTGGTVGTFVPNVPPVPVPIGTPVPIGIFIGFEYN
jgi:hypothetical protein